MVNLPPENDNHYSKASNDKERDCPRLVDVATFDTSSQHIVDVADNEPVKSAHNLTLHKSVEYA